jgi:hypothetical protein
MNKVVVGLAPPPNTTVVRPKVDSWSKHMIYVRDGSDVKIHNKKLDLTHVKPKIDIRKMKEMLHAANKKDQAGCDGKWFGST